MKTLENTPNAAAGSGSAHRIVRHLDLFSGIGGFALAAKWVGGIETVAFCEINPYARKVLTKNFPRIPIHDDVRTLNPENYGAIDLITGGFPCQPFSSAGQRKGEDDDRYLWPEMRRIIEAARPRWVLSENVVGLTTLGLDQVLAEMEAIGYSAQATVIPACAVDAPHRRDRVWIIAHAAGKDDDQHVCKRPDDKRTSASSHGAKLRTDIRDYPRWASEPGVCRVDDGVPARVDRNHVLGNAIVPQVAAEILRAMMVVDGMFNNALYKTGAT